MNSKSSGMSRADKSGVFELCFVTFLDLLPVRLLHHEYRVRPLHKFSGQRVFRVSVRARGRDTDPRTRGEGLFGGWTSQSVLTANEEDVHSPMVA
jgi:hypothetical protein